MNWHTRLGSATPSSAERAEVVVDAVTYTSAPRQGSTCSCDSVAYVATWGGKGHGPDRPRDRRADRPARAPDRARDRSPGRSGGGSVSRQRPGPRVTRRSFTAASTPARADRPGLNARPTGERRGRLRVRVGSSSFVTSRLGARRCSPAAPPSRSARAGGSSGSAPRAAGKNPPSLSRCRAPSANLSSGRGHSRRCRRSPPCGPPMARMPYRRGRLERRARRASHHSEGGACAGTSKRRLGWHLRSARR